MDWEDEVIADKNKRAALPPRMMDGAKCHSCLQLRGEELRGGKTKDRQKEKKARAAAGFQTNQRVKEVKGREAASRLLEGAGSSMVLKGAEMSLLSTGGRGGGVLGKLRSSGDSGISSQSALLQL